MSIYPSVQSARFSLEAELGAGGFGVVHRAHDRETNERVALKILKKMDADSLYRFKNEFRALADIVHTNLVDLHELVCEGGQWFFTMELVEGQDFLTHVFGGPGPSQADTTPDVTQPMEASSEAGRPELKPLSSDIDRLRPALRQLVEGVAALHANGKLHCDIKPGNVLVTGEGRVVLLDFGLVTELSDDSDHPGLLGTPMYVAPEQIQGMPLSEASDWYSVGVLLYQALTGRNPFRASDRVVLTRKQTEDPPAPREIVLGVPQDLDEICMDMLSRDPSARPKDAELIRRLGGQEHLSSIKPLPLVGRRTEQEVLAGALEKVKNGQAILVHAHGRSGIGKTTLLQRFCEEIQGPELVVLKGRCFELESVPYNALDSLMDSLSQYLARTPRRLVLELLPQDLYYLVQLFPVLKTVRAVAESIRLSASPPIEPREQRRRAFSALRELIAGISRDKTVVLLLDDLQWGDVDSAALLRNLFKPPRPPPVLVLASYREEGIQQSPLVQSLRTIQLRPDEAEFVDLAIGELSPDAARELVRALVPKQGSERLVESIVEESRGNPFFIQTLARSTEPECQQNGDVKQVSLEGALQKHLDSLPEQARTLLELVAVAGIPIHEQVLRMALGDESFAAGTIRTLRTGHLIRTSAVQQRGVIEPYHDQIRQAVVNGLQPEKLRAHHGSLGQELESVSGVDPEILAAHFEGAGNNAKAASYIAQAAQRADETLAFDRGAALYWKALTLQPDLEESEARELKAKLANALSNAGRGSEAAPFFQSAAVGAEEQLALERRRRAAEEWMKNGHIEAGLDILREVLAAHGMKLASTPRRAVLSLLWRRLQLKLRGLKFKQVPAEQIDPEVLARIDLCWAVWICLGMADFIRATGYHTLNLMLSLDAGEPYRIARALVMESSYLASTGARAHNRVSDMLRLAGDLADQVGNRHAQGLVKLGTGFGAYLEGRFKEVHGPCAQAEAMLRDLPGTSWELANARHYLLEGLMYTGRLLEDGELLAGFIEDAESRGDLFGELCLRLHAHTRLLADDQPRQALKMIELAMSRYTQAGVHISHYWDFYARGQIRLYTGEGLRGWEKVARRFKHLKRSQMLRVEVASHGALYLRGRMALCAALESAAESGRADAKLLGVAWRDARRLVRGRTEWGRAAGWQTRAAVQVWRGDTQAARQNLERAIGLFGALNMVNWVAAAKRGLGCLIGGKVGENLIAESEAVMMSQQIRDPRRFACMLAPGFDNPGRITGP